MPIDESDVALHRKLVHQWINAFNGHNVSAMMPLYAENAELFDAGMKHPRRGRNEIERWFTVRFQTMPTITYTPTGQFIAEERAAVIWSSSGRTPCIFGQGWLSRAFQVDGVSIFTLREGLIQTQRGYYDHLSVVEQVLPFLKWILPARL